MLDCFDLSIKYCEFAQGAFRLGNQAADIRVGDFQVLLANKTEVDPNGLLKFGSSPTRSPLQGKTKHLIMQKCCFVTSPKGQQMSGVKVCR